MTQPPNRLYRNRTDRKIAGVLGGVADYLGLDPSLVRIGYVVLTFFTLGVPGIVFYLLAAFIIPSAPESRDESPPG